MVISKNHLKNVNKEMLTDNQEELLHDIHGAYFDLIHNLNLALVESREKSLALTKLEESFLWARETIFNTK